MSINMIAEGDFSNILNRLQRFVDSDETKALRILGEQGIGELERATPRDSGETARSWDYTIKRSLKGPILGYQNHGHPNLGVNIAILKQVGHGTGTGGYVPPNDYIRPAMNRVFANASGVITKELNG